MLNKLMKRNSDAPATTKGVKSFEPAVDIYETKDNLKLVFDVPGTKKENIDVNVENDILTMTARIEDYLPETIKNISREYVTGNYKRSFTLIEHVDRNKIEAEYNNGVLELVLPKSEELKPRQIEIK